MIHHYFRNRTFQFEFDLFIGERAKMISYWKRKLKWPDLEDPNSPFDNGSYFNLENEKQGRRYRVIWLEKFDWSVRDQGLLVHEMLHLVLAVFNDKGIPINKDNEESMTYTLEWCVETVFWKLRNLNPKHKKK